VANDQAHQRLQPRPSPLWWGYLALFMALFAVTFVNYVAEGFFQSFGAMLVSWALLSADAVCIAGLYAYIRQTALFAPAFWVAVLTVVVARMGISASFFALSLTPWEAAPEQYEALVGVASMLLSLPMLAALWIYALRSPHIWRDSAALRAVVRTG
jgi:hypothetical protein